MSCEDIRIELSARLDGEGDPALKDVVDEHLAGCTACTEWQERADAVTRLARTAAALPTPELSPAAMAAVLKAAPIRPAPPKAARWLRVALLAVGLGQFLLGIAQISAYAAADHAHVDPVGSVTSGHLWHESAAWNVAVGAAMAWLAWRRTRPAALIPVMTAFIAMLTLLTANDALAGRVEASRILSHSLVLTGYVLLLVMNRSRLRDTRPPAAKLRPGHDRVGGHEDDDRPAAMVLPFPVRPPATALSATEVAATVQRRRAA